MKMSIEKIEEKEIPQKTRWSKYGELLTQFVESDADFAEVKGIDADKMKNIRASFNYIIKSHGLPVFVIVRGERMFLAKVREEQ